MKITILLSFVILVSFVNASEWAPIGSKWTYLRVSGTGEYSTTLEVIADTTINGDTYRKIEEREIRKFSEDGLSYSWINVLSANHYLCSKQDTLWYFNPANKISIPLYAWDLQKGDQLTVNANSCSEDSPFCNEFSYVVDSVGSKMIGDSLVRFQIIKAAEDTKWALYQLNTSKDSVTVYEGIGSLDYLFGFNQSVVLEGGVDHLVCYESGSFFYKDPDYPFTCDYLPELNSIKDSNGNLNFELVQSSGFIQIESDTEDYIMKLYTLGGMLIDEGQSISYDNLPETNYILAIYKSQMIVDQQIISF